VFTVNGAGQGYLAQKINQPIRGAKTAKLTIEPTTGLLNIAAAPETGNLIEGAINLRGNEPYLEKSQIVDDVMIYDLRSDNSVEANIPSNLNRYAWNLNLSPDIPMSLQLKMAAGEIHLDASQLNVTGVDLNVAVGAATMTLSGERALNGKVRNAVGSLTLFVPPGAALKVNYKGALSTIIVPPGYLRTADSYSSPNYAGSSQRIELDVNQSIGTFTVREQTGR
jgi:hypothetical protein